MRENKITRFVNSMLPTKDKAHIRIANLITWTPSFSPLIGRVLIKLLEPGFKQGSASNQAH